MLGFKKKLVQNFHDLAAFMYYANYAYLTYYLTLLTSTKWSASIFLNQSCQIMETPLHPSPQKMGEIDRKLLI